MRQFCPAQKVLEVKLHMSCSRAVPDGNNSTQRGLTMQPSSKQLRPQQKQRGIQAATPTSKHTAAESAASSAVQLLKDELAHKLQAAVQRSSPGIKVRQLPSLQAAACEPAVHECSSVQPQSVH
jgi:hypothetical protein